MPPCSSAASIDPLPDRVLVGEVDPGHPRRLLDVTADDSGALRSEELGRDGTLSPGGPGDEGDAGQRPGRRAARAFAGPQTGGATKTPLSGSLNESRAMISDIGSEVPQTSWVIGSAMS